MPDRFPTDTTSDPAGDPGDHRSVRQPDLGVHPRAGRRGRRTRGRDCVGEYRTRRDAGRLHRAVAFTHTVWAVIDIAARDNPHEPRWRTRARQRGESTRGRAHDVLWLAAVAARCAPDCDIVRYAVLMTLEGTGGSLVPKTLRIKARIDGDGVTIGFSEDF
jgi:hypothetical protein